MKHLDLILIIGMACIVTFFAWMLISKPFFSERAPVTVTISKLSKDVSELHEEVKPWEFKHCTPTNKDCGFPRSQGGNLNSPKLNTGRLK
jgi:hypothetical protein